MTAQLKERLREAAESEGFGAFGVARAEPLESERERLEAWLSAGRHGSMSYLARNRDMRLDPEQLLEGAKSVIVVAHVYVSRGEEASSRAKSGSGLGAHGSNVPLGDGPSGERPPFIARYARGRDYHRVLRAKLKRLAGVIEQSVPDARSRVCVDTAPLLEKAWAERAGVGWRGKHTNLVSRVLGSWTVLGEVLTTLELEPDRPHLDFCGSCRRCLDACPTRAFPEPYVMDATRCISYLTIEHRGVLEPEEGAALGDRLFGCDDCLAVCPWNGFQEPTDEPDFLPREDLVTLDLDAWQSADDATLDARLRGSAMRRAGIDGIRRNAAAVARNRERPGR